MPDNEMQDRKPEDVVKLEKAKSDRSTCRATGEKIKKGEWRVGIEAWRAGRNTITWQRAVPFLKNCHIEECDKANSGTCKLTGHKFKKGETRFVCSTGDKKMYLTVAAAAVVIQPVIDAEDGNFSASQIQGLDGIPEADKEEFEQQFAAKAGQWKPEQEAPEEGKEENQAGKRQRKSGKEAGKEAKKQRAKRAKTAKKGANEAEEEPKSEAEESVPDVSEEEEKA